VGKNAAKKYRKISIGWMMKGRNGILHKVGKKNGGGTRDKIEIGKDATKNDILERALGIFFPNGHSKKGEIADFQFDVLDSAENSITDDRITVREMYDATGFNILRFYLQSVHVNDEENKFPQGNPAKGK
jgi:hypothetical protein